MPADAISAADFIRYHHHKKIRQWPIFYVKGTSRSRKDAERGT
jgi:hypothetical protein